MATNDVKLAEDWMKRLPGESHAHGVEICEALRRLKYGIEIISSGMQVE